MILSTSHYPPLPTSDPITTTSFHAYPISSRSSLHTVLLPKTSHPRSLRGPAYLPTQDASRSSSRCPIAGPGPTSLSLRHERKALKRAEKRAVAGQRPAGVGMAIDADDLSEEEETLREEKVSMVSGFWPGDATREGGAWGANGSNGQICLDIDSCYL